MSAKRSAVLSLCLLAVAGCGGGSSGSTTPPKPTRQAAASPPAHQAALNAAEHPSRAQFPTGRGKTLSQIARVASSQAGLGLSTGTFTPGTNRFGFALVSQQRSLLYGPTALYVARTPSSPATGPFLAPIDPMVVPAAFRSRNAAAGPDSIEAIYSTHVPLPGAGNYFALALARVGGKFVAATGPFIVKPSSPIPEPGGRGPAIATLTPSDVHRDLAKISTRIPPDDMNKVSFKDVVGKRPVALLFSTPALCQSRVCGPVTDVAMYMEHKFGSKMTFIHQEVYVDNNLQKGLRPQLLAYHLQTEPWLFTFDKRGRIAARLEGAFGINEFTQAIRAALR